MTITDSSFAAALETAHRSSLDFLNTLTSRRVSAAADLQTLRKRLNRPLADESVPPERVIAELVSDVEGGIVASTSGRFFSWVIGGSVPAALAADWLTAAWDQNAALYACGPAAAVVEEVAGEWLKQILGLPTSASFAFVTGCQMAHATCLAAARHALLERRGWDVAQKGLYGAPPIRILSSRQRHGSFERAAQLLGLGTLHIEYLESDETDRLQADSLAKALNAEPEIPTIVLMQAGDINIGAFDSFEHLVPLAKQYNAWVHVDGAFGLWVAASPAYRHLVRGVQEADSWATDGHKWLKVPFDCGYAFVADNRVHRSAMSHRAEYLIHDDEARDQIDWNPEWSRRARGFPTYAALRQLGRNGVAAIVERCCRHAHSIVMRIGNLPGAEILWEPIINQGLVRFLDSKPGATQADHDRKSDEVITAVTSAGEAFFGGTTWRGRRAMRVSVCNWQTSDADVERAVKAVENVLCTKDD